MQYTDNAQKDPLPTTLRAGFAINYDLDSEGYNRITLATDVSKIMARKKKLSLPKLAFPILPMWLPVPLRLYLAHGTPSNDSTVKNM